MSLAEVLSTVSAREAAYATWITVGIIFVFSSKYKRSLAYSVIKTASQPKLVGLYFSLIIFTSVICIALSKIGLWEVQLIKTTVIWMIFSGIILISDSLKLSDRKITLVDYSKDQFKSISVVEFITSTYGFSFLVEFLLMPIIFLLVAATYTLDKNAHHRASNLLNNIITLLGIAMVVTAAYGMIFEFGELASRRNIYEFATPAILSIAMIPYAYGLACYIVYDSLFSTINVFTKNKKLAKEAKRKVVMSFNVNLHQVITWKDIFILEKINSRDDIDLLIERAKRNSALELSINPPKPLRGWPQNEARVFLERYQLSIPRYKELYKNEWFGSSPYIKLDESINPNVIAYYVEGGRKYVRLLKVTLNINNKQSEDSAIEDFLLIVDSLQKKSIGTGLPTALERAIRNLREASTSNQYSIVRSTVYVNHWKNGRGLTLKYQVEKLEDLAL